MLFYWNWVLSKYYGAFSYTLNFDNSAVVGFGFGLCWHHTINKIPFLCLCCATDINCVAPVSAMTYLLKVVVYNDMYFEVFFLLDVGLQCWLFGLLRWFDLEEVDIARLFFCIKCSAIFMFVQSACTTTYISNMSLFIPFGTSTLPTDTFFSLLL